MSYDALPVITSGARAPGQAPGGGYGAQRDPATGGGPLLETPSAAPRLFSLARFVVAGG